MTDTSSAYAARSLDIIVNGVRVRVTFHAVSALPMRPYHYESPAPMKRIRALPSFTALRFAPPALPRQPARQHKRAAFVRCYQRRRESKATRGE